MHVLPPLTDFFLLANLRTRYPRKAIDYSKSDPAHHRRGSESRDCCRSFQAMLHDFPKSHRYTQDNSMHGIGRTDSKIDRGDWKPQVTPNQWHVPYRKLTREERSASRRTLKGGPVETRPLVYFKQAAFRKASRPLLFARQIKKSVLEPVAGRDGRWSRMNLTGGFGASWYSPTKGVRKRTRVYEGRMKKFGYQGRVKPSEPVPIQITTCIAPCLAILRHKSVPSFPVTFPGSD